MTGTRTWQLVLAVVATIGGASLWLGLLGRIAQIIILYWKVGDGRVTAGSTAFSIFLVASVCAGSIGLLVARATAPGALSRLARGAGIACLCAGATWVALVVSPFVQLVER